MSRARAADAVAAGVLALVVTALYLLLWTATGWYPPQAPTFGSAMVATTVVAVVARPVHRRLRSAVRRRAGVPLVSVPRSVRATVEAGRSSGSIDDVGRQVLSVLVGAVRPVQAELWAGTGPGSRRIAAWPGGPPTRPRTPIVERTLCHAGIPVGRLRVGLRYGGSEYDELLDAWCGQAGQVMAVLAHREHLRRREVALVRRRRLLRRSRLRVVAAERAARRRIERDLHDGAQQQLLAVGLAMQVARRSAGRSPERSRAALDRAVTLARRSAADLARVSAALYPARLRTGHLAEVIEQAVDGGDLVVVVEQGHGGVGDELTVEARTALYFVAMEAVQNAVKHGRATRATIRLSSDDHHVHLEIVDEGVGVAAETGRPTADGTAGPGAGLRHLQERLTEVGGWVTMRTDRPSGVTVAAAVPRSASTTAPGTRTSGRTDESVTA